MTQTTCILALLQLPKIGPKTALKIIQLSDEIMASEDALIERIKTAKSSISRVPSFTDSDVFNAFEKAEMIIKTSEILDIQVLAIGDEKYPKRFNEIENPPVVIYVKGNLEALHDLNTVAVIGTREPTDYGRKAGYALTKQFIEKSFTIVSGLALGCDTVAHQCSVDHRAKTIAVLSSGVDCIYPKQNAKLAENILENNGTLISEYPPGAAPKRNYFVERDRLQSSLSNGVCIIEMAVKSGTMHTFNFAKAQNKPVGALGHPKHEQSAKSEGNLKIIREQKGYKLESKKDIQEFINLIEFQNEVESLDVI